ncbi:hypothetical protein [Streptomyces mirabilis]|uniref:hypothetical protein n=1 Tax=Streptomyces mirabilis TaxID=68239 RepID=UPI003684FFA2
MRPRHGLSREERDQLDEVRIACPGIATACDQARVFASLVQDRRGHLLADGVREAETNGPGPARGFAGFLRQDRDAVLAGMTLDYSSGVVEGHVKQRHRLLWASANASWTRHPSSVPPDSRDLPASWPARVRDPVRVREALRYEHHATTTRHRPNHVQEHADDGRPPATSAR